MSSRLRIRRKAVTPAAAARPLPFAYAHAFPAGNTARLAVGDAVTTTGGIDAGAFDLVFVDPPFNIGRDYYGFGPADDRRDPKLFRNWLNALVVAAARTVRPGGAVFFHLPDALVPYVALWLAEAGLTQRNWVVLHQEFGQYREANFIVSKNHLLYYVKPGGNLTWNVEEVLEPSARLRMGDRRVARAKYRGRRPFLDVWCGPNLGRVQGNNAERWGERTMGRNHDNQLPEMYLARVVRCASRPGDLVADLCVGSGTTGVVACALGRDFYGVEKHRVVANSAWKRIVERGPVRDVAGPLAVDGKLDAAAAAAAGE